MNTEAYEDINFYDIEIGDVVQMKRPGQSRFNKRIAIAKTWDHEYMGRVFEGLRRTDKVIAERLDTRNQLRRITIK